MFVEISFVVSESGLTELDFKRVAVLAGEWAWEESRAKLLWCPSPSSELSWRGHLVPTAVDSVNPRSPETWKQMADEKTLLYGCPGVTWKMKSWLFGLSKIHRNETVKNFSRAGDQDSHGETESTTVSTGINSLILWLCRSLWSLPWRERFRSALDWCRESNLIRQIL